MKPLAALKLGFYSRVAYDSLPFFGASVDEVDRSLRLLADEIPNTNLYLELRRWLSVIKVRYDQKYQLSSVDDQRQASRLPGEALDDCKPIRYHTPCLDATSPDSFRARETIPSCLQNKNGNHNSPSHQDLFLIRKKGLTAPGATGGLSTSANVGAA